MMTPCYRPLRETVKTSYAGSMLLWLLLGVLTVASAADLSEAYDWKPMKIGGGGWVVGMDIHPTEKGLMYVRTDVAGAYRWIPSEEKWRQIVTASSLPEEFVYYGGYRGVDSLVAAPSDPDVAYMAYQGEIFRSSDRGEHWRVTNFASNDVAMEPNGEGRQEGERLAVDPYNSDIVYYGSVHDGLWHTADAGGHWTQVSAIPAGSAPHGVNTIVFNPGSDVSKSDEGALRTQDIYVTSNGVGVFRSDDAGRTWESLSEDTPLSTADIREATLGPDGTYYVATNKTETSPGAVWKYAQGDWVNITPKHQQGGSQAYWGIAVHPKDPELLVVLCSGGQGFVSRDQGKSWSHRGFTLTSDDVLWLGQQENYWLSVGECVFDPAGKLWFAEGFGVWWANDLSGSDIEWHAASKGIEETCGNDVIAPPGGEPVAAMWDVGVFRFPQPEEYNAERGFPYFMSAWSLDWCPADPDFIAGVFRNHNGFPPHVQESGYSTDGGLNWTIFPAIENGTAPKALDYGVVAVSAESTENIVWLPANNHPPYFTTDRGEHWQQAVVTDVQETGFNNHYSPLKALCADRVLPATFYLYLHQHGVFRSTDGGAHFLRVGNPISERYNATLKAAPGHAGHLWFAEGSQGTPVGGLWRSTDGGESWVAVPGIEQAFNFGFGKSKEPGGYPTLFAAGVAEGQTGMWRSIDEGKTWDKIGSYPLGIFDWIDAIDGDKDVFGVVYIAFSGSGFAYGQPTR